MAWPIPEGYEVLSGPFEPGVKVIAAARARDALLSAGIDRPEILATGPAVAEWVDGGRVRHPVISFGDDLWLLKSYRRGGVLSRWNLDRYWAPKRFLRELETAARAVNAGVPASQPIALVFKPAGWGSFRAWQIVRYVPDVRSLRDFLNGQNSPADRSPETICPVFRAAGEAVRRMHDAEIDHPDLNIGNILVRTGGGQSDGSVGSGSSSAKAFIIDWDRARFRPKGTWNPHRNLLRLWRSAVKLARLSHPSRRPDAAALRAFLRGYFRKNRAGLRSLRGYARPRLALMAFHAFFWESARNGRTG
jgi:3-deoxy-D-manno-octulosonic acid kinase